MQRGRKFGFHLHLSSKQCRFCKIEILYLFLRSGKIWLNFIPGSTMTELCGVTLAIHFYFPLAICFLHTPDLSVPVWMSKQFGSYSNMHTLHLSFFPTFVLNGFRWYGYSFLFHCGVTKSVLQIIQHVSVFTTVMQELYMAWYCW